MKIELCLAQIAMVFFIFCSLGALAKDNPFVRSVSKGRINQIAMDLDKDGQFDFYEISWGPLSIKKTFTSAFKSDVFIPSFEISLNLRENVYYAYYLCDKVSCRLTRSFVSNPKVFHAEALDRSPDEGIHQSDSGESVICNSGSPRRDSIKQNVEISREVMISSTAQEVLGESCRTPDIAAKTGTSAHKISKDFSYFLGELLDTEHGASTAVGQCMASSGDLQAIGTLMVEKIKEIQNGKGSLTVSCEIVDSTSDRPKMTKNPNKIHIPIPKEKTCRLNFTSWFAHEFGHIGPGNIEPVLNKMELCFGPPISAQLDTCGNDSKIALKRVSEAAADGVAMSVREDPVNIPAASLQPASPGGHDRGIASLAGKEPAAAIVEQALSVVDAARSAAPARFAEAGFADMSYFDVSTGNLGGSNFDRPAPRLASNSVLSKLANSGARTVSTRPTAQSSPERADRGTLSDEPGKKIAISRSSLYPESSSPANASADPPSSKTNNGPGMIAEPTRIKQDRSPASSDPSKPTVASPSSAPQQQKAAAAEIPNPGSVAKPVSKISQPQGGNSIGSDLRTQGGLVSNQGQGIQKMGGDRSAETSNPQVSQVLKEIREKLGKNTNPDSLKDLLQKSEPILESNSIRIGFRSPGDKFTFLGARKDTAKRVYHILDGKLIEIQRK